jgi:hypothetical protein
MKKQIPNVLTRNPILVTESVAYLFTDRCDWVDLVPSLFVVKLHLQRKYSIFYFSFDMPSAKVVPDILIKRIE